MTKKILFTSIGRRVELTQAFRSAADKLNMDLCIIGADYSDSAPALFYCDKTYQVCKIKDAEYIPQLLDICEKEQVDLLIPTIDTDLLVLAENAERFARIGTKVMVSAPDKVALCRDKRYTADFLLSCGVQSPKPVDDVELYAGGYPCFIKPRDGSSSIDAYKIDSEEELLEISKRVPNYIIQPFISGKEYTVDIFCDYEGNPVMISPRERLATRSGEVLKTCMIRDEATVKECLQIIEKFKPCGALAVQYIKDEATGVNYYIEINPRFGGGAPLSMKAGADMAQMTLRQLNGECLSYVPDAGREGEIYSRFDQSICTSVGRCDRVADYIIQDIKDAEALCDKYDAIVLDLDDTLYSEKDYVRSGYRKIAELFPEIQDAYEQLWSFFEEGKPAIDCFLEENHLEKAEWKEKCLNAYREQEPEITVYPGVYDMLKRLRTSGKKIGIITDGRVSGQYAKVESLDLKNYVDEIIVTDELAGNGDVKAFRKPSTIAFEVMQRRLGVTSDRMVYVGDNAKKDFVAPKRLGMGSIWFQNADGLYQ